MPAATTLHAQALVWDNHGCMPDHDTAAWLDQLDQYRQGGADVTMINIGDSLFPLEHLMRMAAHVRGYVRDNPDRYVMATSVEAIRAAKAAGKLAIGLDVEGAFSIGDQLSLVQLYYDLGVRWMLMTYNRRNLVGSGCHDETDEGLTPFGRQLCAEMDRVGMVKCCTHTGDRTAMQVMAETDLPTIFSHSNVDALRPHPRNISDEMIDACAATGGVVCINGLGLFLSDRNEATPQRFCDHLDHVAQRVGARHVGIGLDYVFDQEELDRSLAADGNTWPASFGYQPGIAFLGPRELPTVTQELLRRNWSEADVRAVLGGNLMRVAEKVWKPPFA
jgi:membrane dipeptidase